MVRGILAPAERFARSAVWCLACLALVVLTACSNGGAGPAAGSADASAGVTPHGGAQVDVQVSQDAVRNKPAPWVLSSPEAAVRSYLAWTSYANRIAQSEVATATMTPNEEVVVDSYIQYNIQKGRLIDQTLESITFGKPSAGTTSTLVPAKERWSYRYVSVGTPGKTLGGPYTASYESTYTVVKSDGGVWRVDHSVTKPLGTVK